MANIGDDPPPEARPRGIRWVRIAILVGAAVALYLLGRWFSDMLAAGFEMSLRARNGPLLQGAVVIALLLYIIVLAIPFMPAVEIGLALLMIFRGEIALLVYGSTLAALVLAYLAGKFVPPALVGRAFGGLGLTKARDFVGRIAPMSAEERMVLIARHLPAGLSPYLVRYRFLALAVLFNLPGNAVIGGGGGIAMLAGMTRVFPFPAYLLTVALAVAPVPLLISITG